MVAEPLERRALLSAAGDAAAPITSVDDAYTAWEDVPIEVSAAAGVLANDATIDGAALTAELVSPPGSGTLSLNADGSFQYLPERNFHGTLTFTYRAAGGGSAGPDAVATLTVNSVNDEPWVGMTSAALMEDTATMAVAFAAGDADGDVLAYTITVAPEHGSVEVLPDGTWIYTPTPGFNGSDSFRYQAFDGQAYSRVEYGRVSIMVMPKPDAPQVIVPEPPPGFVPPVTVDPTPPPEETPLVVYEDTPITGAFEDPPQPPATGARVKFSVASKAAHGKVKVFKNGTFRYIPRRDYLGRDAFCMRARTRGPSGTIEERVIELEVVAEGFEPWPEEPEPVYEPITDPLLLPPDVSVWPPPEDNPPGSEPIVDDGQPWALPTADFIFYESPAHYYASEQYAYIASGGRFNRELDFVGVMVVLHDGATIDVAPGEPLKADLVLAGTTSPDMIGAARTADGRVALEFNGRPLGTFAVTGAVRLYGLDGADWLIGQGDMAGLELYGGYDYDFLQGSDGPDLLCGGEHGDTLAGGAGDDVLLGGLGGGDHLRGGLGSDLLHAGATPFDPESHPADPRAADDALAALLAAWSAATPFADRVAALSAPGGPFDPAALTGDFRVDAFLGGEDADWFVNVGTNDTTDRSDDEPLAV